VSGASEDAGDTAGETPALRKTRRRFASTTGVRNEKTFLQRVALGAVAGAGATILLQGVMKASAKAIPEGKPPMRKDPGKFMANMALPAGAPDALHEAAAKSLQRGYGTTSGAFYAAGVMP